MACGAGTRPGKVDHPGPKWSEKEFARAVGVKTDRTIRNWLKDAHPPKDTRNIERALFGASEVRYSGLRRELRQAHATTRGIERDDLAEGSGAIERQPDTGKPLPVSNISIRVPIHFMGRDNALAEIEAAFNSGDGRLGAAITALHGLRGVGKSTLAAAYAERHRSDYRATWWIKAQTEAGLRADVVALGIRLGWVAADEQEEPALTAVMERLRQEGDGILLIFDNAINADALKPYLPRGGAARVLITSNAHAWRGVATPVETQVWPKETGADFLIARTGRAAERTDAKALSEALGGLPLAHEQAAAYCEWLHVSFRGYLKRFAAAPAQILDDARHAPAEYGATVARTFLLAIEEAAKLHPAAEPLIAHAALLPPDPIPLFLFAKAHEKFDGPLRSALAGDGLDEAVATLRAFALVDRETVADARDVSITIDVIRLHRLVREVAAQRADQRRERMRQALAAALAAVYPDNGYRDPASWPRCAALTPHLLSICEIEMTDAVANTQRADLLGRAGDYFHGRAAYSEARPLYVRALAIHQKVLGPEHSDTAKSLNNLAMLLQAQGDLARALPLFKDALAILGPEHPDRPKSLNNLALLLQDQGDLAGALPLYEDALAIQKKVLGPEHPHTLSTLNNLATLRQDQGDLEGAKLLFEDALAIRKKVPGPGHPDTASSLNNLAMLIQDQGDLARARPLFEEALAIYEKVLGPEHPHTATSLNNFAFLLAAQGDLAGARFRYERALEIREKVLGPEHSDTAKSLNNLARTLSGIGDTEKAETLFKRAIAIDEKTHGGEHPLTQHHRSHYARHFLNTGRAAEALSLTQAALATHEMTSGPNHPWTKDSARVVADALEALNHGEEAAALRERYDIEH
jgi:tetratricopeptide (TPR) repeat protein